MPRFYCPAPLATGLALSMVGTLLDEMERCGARTGIVTLCAGLGLGVATLIERI